MLFRWFKWVGLFFLVSITAFFLAAYLYLHRGSRPWIKTSFPAISDWNSLRITLSRGPCLGTCPVYKVTIDGRGDVAFVGDVRSPAHLYPQVHRTYRINEAYVHSLFDAFRKAQFFWLYDDYGLAELDTPTCKIGIEFDGHRKEVIDNLCTEVGMPKDISNLEATIDRIAGIEKFLASEGPSSVNDAPPEPALRKVKPARPSPPKIVIERTEPAP